MTLIDPVAAAFKALTDADTTAERLNALHSLIAACHVELGTPGAETAAPAVPAGRRDRELDRQRFPDPDFNRWMDETIVDNGEFTVWHLLWNTRDALAGWQNCPHYFRVLTAPQALAVPAGWKLVPETPTQEMCQQGQWKAQEWPKFPLRISPIYQAMIAAAPARE